MHTSVCIFFANNIIAIYFIFFSDYRNDARQKANSSSKWLIKQLRQLATSTKLLAHELLMNVQCRASSRSFAKETRAIKMRSTMTGHLKLTLNN